MKKVGVFVCHCGINIAQTVDVKKVVEEISKEKGVVFVTDYTYMCSTPGQELIVDSIKKHKLDGVVIASCSPRMHELTFRKAAAKAGLNEFMCEIANIREQCSWVHEDIEKATPKAISLIRSIIEKVRGDSELHPLHIKVKKRALVIGAGIAGMQTALDIANGGHEVILVERESSIGGHMAQLGETFPTLDCASCIFTPKIVEVAQHEKIKTYAYSEIEEVSGIIGDFKVKIRKKARGVDPDKCTGCGICMAKCPTKITSKFNRGIGVEKAISIPFPQAYPNIPAIDKEACRFFKEGKCKVCEKLCQAKAIKYDQKDEFVEEEVGAIVVATGYELLRKDFYGEYGYGKYKDVIDGLQLERMLSASGPTKGKILRPSDGKEPKQVVFVACVGSRDDAKGISYCSKICCMYTAKHAMLYKHRVPDGQTYIFYMDVRAGGKKYEEFYKRATTEDGAVYLRARVSKIFEKNDKIIVRGADTLSGLQVEVEADMVVLASAIVPRPDAEQFARKLRISYDEHKFFSEAHVKLRPVETNTAGIFLTGMCQGPKDIQETVSQAGCAASKILGLFSSDELTHEPIVAWVDEEICSGCGLCVSVCPYDAREIDSKKKVAKIKEVLCEGCGACVGICPNKAGQQRNFSSVQYLSMIDSV